jgi:Uma2 family endonuclease
MNINKPRHQFERMSLEDFEELLADKPDNEKWELIGGRVVRGMVGARWEDHLIIRNIDLAISNHLHGTGRPCFTFRETFYLKEAKDDLAALPDLMVRCGRLESGATSLNDPVIVVEVVSPGSEARDRMEKRVAYQALPALATYVIVERDRMLVDVYERGNKGFDSAISLQDAHDRLKLPSIGFEMTLADIYRDIIAPPAT